MTVDVKERARVTPVEVSDGSRTISAPFERACSNSLPGQWVHAAASSSQSATHS